MPRVKKGGVGVGDDASMWDVVMQRRAEVLLVLVVTWQHDEEVGVGGDTLRWFWWCWTYT